MKKAFLTVDAVYSKDNFRTITCEDRKCKLTIYNQNTDIDFSGCYAVPGFVNAHTHLELTSLENCLERNPPSFMTWVKDLLCLRMKWGVDDWRKSLQKGVFRSIQGGSTTILNHCSSLFITSPWTAADIRGGMAVELSGIESEKADEKFKEFEKARNENREIVRAIAPHAPYSTAAETYSLSAKYAKENDLLLSLHLAEIKEEEKFLNDGEDPFSEYAHLFPARDLSSFKPPVCSPIEYMEKLGALGKNVLAVHCNYLSDKDIELIASTGTSVVHCPSSYNFFGHTSFRMKDLKSAGVNICLEPILLPAVTHSVF